MLATEAGTGRALRRASVARVTARTVTCLADSALRAKSRCNMPAGTPARHAKIPGSIPGRGAQHAHAARRAGHGPRAVAHMGRPRHCCTPGTSALRPLLRAPRAGLLLQHVDPLVLCQRPARATSPCGCAPPRSHPRHPPAATANASFGGRCTKVRGSIVVSISACHAEDPGSIPGRGGEHCSPQGLARAVQCGAHQLPAHSAHCELPR